MCSFARQIEAERELLVLHMNAHMWVRGEERRGEEAVTGSSSGLYKSINMHH